MQLLHFRQRYELKELRLLGHGRFVMICLRGFPKESVAEMQLAKRDLDRRISGLHMRVKSQYGKAATSNCDAHSEDRARTATTRLTLPPDDKSVFRHSQKFEGTSRSTDHGSRSYGMRVFRGADRSRLRRLRGGFARSCRAISGTEKRRR
jgi:hypothetical protein